MVKKLLSSSKLLKAAYRKVFKEIGFAEELGSGVRKIMQYSKQYFGSEPKFEDDYLFTTTITNFKKGFYQKLGLDEQVSEEAANNYVSEKKSTKEKILDVIKEKPNITKEELVKQFNMSISGIEKIFRQLKKDNIIERIGSRKVGYWKINKTTKSKG